jgi:hypothetical protein
MALKRYELYGSHVGVLEQESESGPWVSAADAQAEMEKLQHDLDVYRDALQSVVTNELPPADPDPINPGEFVIMCPSHMDHEGYRDAVRVAAGLIGIERLYE